MIGDYREEQFNMGYEIVNFLNENGIKREQIISIYASRSFHHLVYIQQ